MTRWIVVVDRVVTAVVGVVLAVAGVAAIGWRFDLWSRLPEHTDTSAASDVFTTSWWPWAAGVGGVLLSIIALRWLWAHVPPTGVGELNLTGTSESGALRFNAKSAASTAADLLSQTAGVRSARGTVKRDRGQLVVDLRATVDADADLEDLAAAADRIVAELAAVMGRRDLYGRVHLAAASKSTPQPRVA